MHFSFSLQEPYYFSHFAWGLIVAAMFMGGQINPKWSQAFGSCWGYSFPDAAHLAILAHVRRLKKNSPRKGIDCFLVFMIFIWTSYLVIWIWKFCFVVRERHFWILVLVHLFDLRKSEQNQRISAIFSNTLVIPSCRIQVEEKARLIVNIWGNTGIRRL